MWARFGSFQLIILPSAVVKLSPAPPQFLESTQTAKPFKIRQLLSIELLSIGNRFGECGCPLIRALLLLGPLVFGNSHFLELYTVDGSNPLIDLPFAYREDPKSRASTSGLQYPCGVNYRNLRFPKPVRGLHAVGPLNFGS